MPKGAELNGLDGGQREQGENLRGENEREDRRGIKGSQFWVGWIKTYMHV